MDKSASRWSRWVAVCGAAGVAAAVLSGWGGRASADPSGRPFRELQEEITTLQGQVATLQSQVTALQNVTQFFSVQGNDVFLTGANLHVVNGTGSTATANAFGNVIIGYNELRNDGTDNRAGSHMLVVGSQDSYQAYGGIVVGNHNTVTGTYSSVCGGDSNTAGPGISASVTGGRFNTASGDDAWVGGGVSNAASGGLASVSGGANNTASGEWSSVSGGGGNTASNQQASVSGGSFNTAGGVQASVSGGDSVTEPTNDGWAAGALHSP